MPYFSARLLYVILVGTARSRRGVSCDETVIVFRARNFDDAFRRSLVLGRSTETEYRNNRGQRVRWALAEIQTIDHIGTRLDGAEVASKLHTRVLDRPLSARSRLHPERSNPGHGAPAGFLGRRKKASRRT